MDRPLSLHPRHDRDRPGNQIAHGVASDDDAADRLDAAQLGSLFGLPQTLQFALTVLPML